jgi:hypothetical protein
MRRASDDSPTPIVFIDLSGEQVHLFAGGESVPEITDALKRADHVPVVVNGRHILNARTRQRTIFQARGLLARVQQQQLRPHAMVSVVITKGDLLGNVDINQVFDDITSGYPVDKEHRFVTADRGEGMRGYGVDRLLTHLTILPEALAPEWAVAEVPFPSLVLKRVWGCE